MLKFGLNPYGLTYHLGLQGMGTDRANKNGGHLDGFLKIAAELKAEIVEIYLPWLNELDDTQLSAVSARLEAAGMSAIVSAGHNLGTLDQAFRAAAALNTKLIRYGLTPVLEGSRNAWGDEWHRLNEKVHATLAHYAPLAEARGYTLAIENHQDFTSQELVRLCEKYGPSIGITYDLGNSFPVAEAPLDFTTRVAPHVRHIHLKDYNVQPTSEGFRLIRCAIGDGAVPIEEILEILSAHRPDLTMVLEPGALEARHIRLFQPDWWQGYPAKKAPELAACLAATQRNALHPDADYRTPWERGDDKAVEEYELAMIRRSAANVNAMKLKQLEMSK